MAEASLARAVILAAGRSTRMVSARSKVLHPVGGLPMLEHLLRAAGEACAGDPLVVASASDRELLDYLEGRAEVVIQESPNGTGDALLAAGPALAGATAALVLPGDMPLLTGATLKRLLEAFSESSAGAALLTAQVSDRGGSGRVVRASDGTLAEIVEEADDGPVQGPWEVSCGVYAFRLPAVFDALQQIGSENRQRERYLSWAPQRIQGGAVTLSLEEPTQALQVNDRVQLAAAEAAMRARTLTRLMLSGVTVTDPQSTWVDCDVEVGPDTVIQPACVLRGHTQVGSGCVLGPFAELEDCQLGDACRVGRSHLQDCKLEDGVQVGPFNRVRPGSQLGPRSHLGTFNELVRSRVGADSRIPHLSYVGDTELGEDVNVGAGTITANWDGQTKHSTVVGPGSRLGSDTVLVAPVTVGPGAYTAAGSVVTSDVPPGALAVARSQQRNVEGWVARRRPSQRPLSEEKG